MTEALGDEIIGFLMLVLAVFWGLGWILLLLIMLIQKLFPKSKQKAEKLLQTTGNLIKVIMKYSLILVGMFLLICFIGLIANKLGW